jgi:hypothetical protein
VRLRRLSWGTSAVVLAGLGLGFGAGLTTPVHGQTPSDLAAACVSRGGTQALCLSSAVTSRALMGHTALVAGFGSEVAGTASNLGTRVGGGPRIALSLRAGVADVGVVDPNDPVGTTGAGFLVPALHAGITLGLFDGVRIMPTVGGFLSTDVFAGVTTMFLPTSEGFAGSERAYSVGVRIGIFREGFTIPGLSVSAARRFVGTVDFGDTSVGGASSSRVAPSVTAYRATIGKDLHAVEVMAGVGREEISGDATIAAQDGLGGYARATGNVGGTRWLYFGSAAMTFSIVLTIAVEAGWAGGFDSVPGYAGDYDPTSGTPFGALSFRLTL